MSAAVRAFSSTPPRMRELRIEHVADELASRGSDIQDLDLRAHLGQKIEQRGARGIQSDAVNGEAGLGNNQRGHQKKRRRGKIARHAQLAAFELGPAGDA